mmetsp:Transcript_13394/g.24034  ORF Transcript_13394/g.24034 Transcript_13394/m.24034 type:complete len:80 (-) Transcript_13394:7-246(-)
MNRHSAPVRVNPETLYQNSARNADHSRRRSFDLEMLSFGYNYIEKRCWRPNGVYAPAKLLFKCWINPWSVDWVERGVGF